MNQKQLHDLSLTSAELLEWRCPGIAARAESAARLGEFLALIQHDKGPRALHARHWLKAQLERVNEISELSRPLEQAREQARAAFAAALERETSAIARVAAATSEDEQDLAELALAKAKRAAAKASESLLAANRAQPPALPGAPIGDWRRAMYQVQEETKHLAALAPQLASFDYRGRSNVAIDMATTRGRSATLGTVPLFAVAEHAYTDPDARKLFNLRWVVACEALGLECDRSKLDLPAPSCEAAT
jgi:hypothetical protein